MEIKRLVPSDAQQYRSLMLQAYEKHPDAFTSSASERSREAISFWKQRLDTGSNAAHIVMGAFSLNKLVGVSGISFATRDKLCHKANVFGMYVDNSVRGSGIAGQLITALLDQARTRKSISIVQLSVSEGNEAALRLFTGIGGFTQFGFEPCALKIGKTYISKIHMWRDINNESSMARA